VTKYVSATACTTSAGVWNDANRSTMKTFCCPVNAAIFVNPSKRCRATARPIYLYSTEEDRIRWAERMAAYEAQIERYLEAERRRHARAAEARRKTIVRARYCKQQIDYYRAAGEAELTSPELRAAVDQLALDISHETTHAIRSAFQDLIRPARLHWSQNTDNLIQLRRLIRERVKRFESVTTSEGLTHILAELGAEEEPAAPQD